MVTLQDIAREAGVSKMTVSNVLRGNGHVSERTAQRVLETAKAMRYRIGARNAAAGSLKRRDSDGMRGTIGIAVSTLRTPWVAELSSCIIDAAKAHNLTAAVEETHVRQEDEADAIRRLSEHFYDGLIFTHSNLAPEIIDRLSMHRPTVLIDYTYPRRALDTVTTDSERGGRLAVEYLASRGFRRLLIVGGTPDAERNSPDINYVRGARLGGCIEAMDRLGLPYDDRSFVGVKWDADLCRAAIGGLGRAAMERFDAVICLNDSAAIGVIRGCRDLGLAVPDDIAVMGMSGIELGLYTTPSLTTVDMDIRRIAEEAVRLLADRIDGGGGGNGGNGEYRGSNGDRLDCRGREGRDDGGSDDISDGRSGNGRNDGSDGSDGGGNGSRRARGDSADPEPRTVNVPCRVRAGESA
ncbi:LacI family DNA-binding transcriptional regulator [Bifidobacterium vespertilionis]|uniref:LacI family DNA-binding transcriptional regulator n=1 Tax=Bifidobacterium vespertilionis TaxID=2562524 RepID=UPI001BDCCAEC|nr:LacI family DNA-binding transcriptional regulator [Bifidobacterium vespertilionis]MBT1180297.1 LacI family DNA-binding transcriptional regulator [Bifidobacterium vespertilionis]